MPLRIPKPVFQSLIPRTGTSSQIQPFSTSRKVHADNPLRGLQDILNPAKTSRPQRTPIKSRAPSSPLRSDSTNPSLLDIPPSSPLPGRGRPAGISEASFRNADRPVMPTFGSSGSTPFGREDTTSTGSGDNLVSMMRQIGGSAETLRKNQARIAEGVQIRQIEGQASRTWRDGDVYAPHDLSPVEMQKARQARMGPRSNNMASANTRKKGGRDILDELGIDPLKEYKNFSMMSEFVTDLGRIRHGRDTGLRAVNQRRMAKAVRRAIGIGIMPSVHRHPELHEERMGLRIMSRGRMY